MSRYTSDLADYFKFIPSFKGRIKDPHFYERTEMFLKLHDPHFRLRAMIDPFDHEPPWYDTVNMVVGCKQAEDDNYEISTVLLLQAVIGELQVGFADLKGTQDVVWVLMLDFFCHHGKHIPEQDDFAILFHVASTEIKSTGADNVFVFARSSKSLVGFKQRSPALVPDFSLTRYGFEGHELAESTLAQTLLRQMDGASRQYLN